jgi:hypothetical protein
MFRTLKNLFSGIKKALSSSFDNREKIIGVIGFEPTASCSQSRRSSQAELHPDKLDDNAGNYPYIAYKRTFYTQHRAF